MGKIYKNGILFAGSTGNARSVAFNNADTDLESTNVQEAIEEVKSEVAEINMGLNGTLLYSSDYEAISNYTIENVDFRGYKYIRILYAINGSNRMVFNDVYVDDNTNLIPLFTLNFPGGVYHVYVRNLNVSHGTITIGTGNDYSILANTKTENNGLLVPIKIWGFK